MISHKILKKMAVVTVVVTKKYLIIQSLCLVFYFYSSDVNTDYEVLLDKISTLQEEKWSMQQKLQMLEHSSAAMADDLMKKSNLITFYCMEGKQRQGTVRET